VVVLGRGFGRIHAKASLKDERNKSGGKEVAP